MANFRTPMARVRGLGSAKDGTEHFWRQRLTAIANVPLVLLMVGLVVALAGSSYTQVRFALANPVIAVLVALAMISVLYHMRLGMQVIIEDYVHDELAKIILIALNIFFSFIIGAATLLALISIVIGG